MGKYASKMIEQAQAWIGLNEANGTHKQIIDIYNNQKPLPVGYKVKYTDAWCATFVSAVAVKLGYTDIIPTECSCPRMITLFKKANIWVEDENRIPNPGDIIFYDWDDKSAAGDNTGSPEHVGLVEKVSGGYITVIEGNYSNSVKRRTIAVNGRYIRGYGVPKYDTETGNNTSNNQTNSSNPTPALPEVSNKDKISVLLRELKKGSNNIQVKTLQYLLKGMGYYTSSIDGDFGNLTDKAVRSFQKNKDLVVDGICGEKTWNKLLKG